MDRFRLAILVVSLTAAAAAAEKRPGPYDRQVAENLAKLRSDAATVRAGAAEALGFLRAYGAEGELIRRLGTAPGPVTPAPPPALDPSLNVELPPAEEDKGSDDESRVGLFRKLRRDAKRRAVGH